MSEDIIMNESKYQKPVKPALLQPKKSSLKHQLDLTNAKLEVVKSKFRSNPKKFTSPVAGQKLPEEQPEEEPVA